MSNHISKEEVKRNNSLKQEKIFIRVDSAAMAFGLSKSHIWGLLASKQLKAFKPSPKITLLKVTDLIMYIEQSGEIR
jgi:predicted DNA-binding transcriptional regulator AlpA